MGAVIRARATGRRNKEKDETQSVCSENEEAVSLTKKLRSPATEMNEEMDFVEALEKGDKARMNMENKKLDLARMQFVGNREQRKKAREERKEEQEPSAALELKNMKLMMNKLTGFLAMGPTS